MKKRIVAIVGRPNVGKSTLFNRIIRRREAIVDDEPGVTRDRNSAPAEWAGVEFDLLDTGGYVPNTTDVFETAIRRQIALAVEEADVIVFLTDVVTGITGIDQEIADFLQQSGAAVILAVNKVDNQKREADILEFYRLGLGDPIPVSSISGRNMGDFLDAVIKKLPQQTGKQTEKSNALKLAVVGRPNVGKSSYINAILGRDKMIVTEIPGTTRDAVDTPMAYNKKQLVLVDTAGLRKRARVHENIEYFSNVRTLNAIRRCDVAVLLL
ncbi:ribosome biogenesis GTPase Der, partial [candidate division KSB1 bacterium]|nr:ribosome biogenesis GTPase Der [candidate division KSB1 bacterium]